MKKYLVFLPVCLVIALFSCTDQGDSYTPDILFSNFLVNPVYSGDTITGAEDTLSLSQKGEYYLLDSIDATDTVVFAVAFRSYGNELVAARVNFDTTQLNVKAKLTDGIKRIMLPETDYRNLQFYINPGYNTLYIPFGYSPCMSGNHKFTFVVESDSKFSPTSVTFCQPVR